MSENDTHENETDRVESEQDEARARARYSHHMLWLAGIFGSVVGALLCAALVFYVVLPARMIETYESRLGLEETVAALERSIPQAGWSVTAVTDLCAGEVDPNEGRLPRVKLVSMCKAEYAEIVLRSNPDIAAIMPCTFAVWEDEDGRVHISQTNTTVLARLFGGQVGNIMGRRVAFDERIILGDLVKDE